MANEQIIQLGNNTIGATDVLPFDRASDSATFNCTPAQLVTPGNFTGTLTVPKGGTGQTTLAAHAVLLGEGASAISSASIGTGGRALIDQGAGADPAFQAISGDITLAATGAATLATVGSAGTFGQVTVNAKGLTTSGTVITDIAHGGSNSSVALNNGCVMVSVGGKIVELAAPSADTLSLVGTDSTGSAVGNVHLVAGSNITITRSSSSITFAASGGGTPGGSNTQVQFNDSGSFGGSASFTFVKATSNLSIAGFFASSQITESLNNIDIVTGSIGSAYKAAYENLGTATSLGFYNNSVRVVSLTYLGPVIGNTVQLLFSSTAAAGTTGDAGFARLGVNSLICTDGASGYSKLAASGITINVAGQTLGIKEGSNACMGTGTLSSGSATISTTAVAANSRIFLTDTGTSIVNLGALTVSAISAGTSFTVKSSNVADTSTFNWVIFNPL